MMYRRFLVPVSVLLAAVFAAAQTNEDLPHLRQHGNATQLVVDGEPYLVLGGELHNSSSTSRAYMEGIWPSLAEMDLNTVLAVVPWGLVEPEEGSFDFSLVDDLIEDAREHELKLILLWFGSWKNGLSHYVPDWVKRDRERFPYASTQYGTLEILSVFSEENRDADREAFTTFMRHLRSVDEEENTVLMVQVQNEVGLHADARDRSAAADAAYAEPVPVELIDYLRGNRENLREPTRSLWGASDFGESGSWADVFGPGERAEEAFMAWHYAAYLNDIAAAGKAEYPLPLFVNAWIVQPEDERPGDYPSGGPQAHVLDIWQAAAPEIDIFAPDIYLPNFQEICEMYAQSGNPLFVPESRAGVQGMAQAFLTVGRFDGIGYAPFGIESHVGNFEGYGTLAQIAPLILEYQGGDRIHAVSLTEENESEAFTLGEYRVEVGLLRGWGAGSAPERGYAILVATGPDEYIVAGSGVQVTFASLPPDEGIVGFARVEEGGFEDGQWRRGRVLSGDEIMISYDFAAATPERQSGTALKFREGPPAIQRATLYRYGRGDESVRQP